MSACPAPGAREDAELLAEIALGVRSVGRLEDATAPRVDRRGATEVH